MKVVYLGTDALLPCFSYFLKEHEIMALYVCGGREDYFREEAISRMAEKEGIPVLRETIDEAAERKYITEGCQLFVSADYGRRIPVIPEEDGFFGINIHTSLLPEGRSYCPVECALERGEKRTGVTIHKLVYELDKGDILRQKGFPIWKDCDSVDLYLKCATVAEALLRDMMKDFPKAWKEAQPQKGEGSTWKLREFSRARIIHGMDVDEAAEIYRIYNRMTRVKIDEDVYFVMGMETGYVPLQDETVKLGEVTLFRLRNGYVRLFLEKAENPEAVWESDRYPFKF